MTYAWLGGLEADAALMAMQFLRNVATNTVALDDVPHVDATHQGDHRSWHPWCRHDIALGTRQPQLMSPVHGSGARPATWHDQCHRCVIESGFRGLVDFCDRPCWRRRWVIQEVTAASQVNIICGDEMITLKQMTKAIEICLASRYWLARNDLSERYMQRIVDFRTSYFHGAGTTLCEALLTTQDFLSKDVRDKVFTLMGVCTDGAELVPTPNYLQSPQTIVRDISRELLRRNMCYDIILIDERRRSDSVALPTWAPDWLSESLPEDAARVANSLPHLRHSFGSQFLRANAETLRLEGVLLGTVVGVTTALGPASLAPGCDRSLLCNRVFTGALNFEKFSRGRGGIALALTARQDTGERITSMLKRQGAVATTVASRTTQEEGVVEIGQ